MVICLIAEGAYPYVTGGVSSWINQLINGLPHIKFKVLSLMPSYKEELEYKYKIPDNLIEIRTIYLDDYLKLKHRFIKRKLRFNKEERECLYKLLSLESDVEWNKLINLISSHKKIGSSVDFLQSKFFWENIIDIYTKKYNEESLNTFFWTVRTMLLPFLNLFHQEIMEADIYHAVSTGYAGIIGVYFKQINKKPFLLTEHGIYAREREEEIIKANWVTGTYKKLWINFFYFISIAAYKEADKIVTLFQRNQDIQHKLGASKEKTEIIHNGVNLENYKIEYEEHEGYNVGAILRIVPIKDVMTLIRAFKIVKDTVDSAKLYLIGPADEDKEYYQQCLGLVKLLKLEKDIIFTGRVDVKEYLKKIDVLVLTSISEGQPLVILEGMASGIPIVSTDVGGCKELLEEDGHEGSCGIVTNLVSASETAAMIIRLIKNPDLRKQMGKNGRIRAERIYSEKSFIDSYKRLYEELG